MCGSECVYMYIWYLKFISVLFLVFHNVCIFSNVSVKIIIHTSFNMLHF